MNRCLLNIQVCLSQHYVLFRNNPFDTVLSLKRHTNLRPPIFCLEFPNSCFSLFFVTLVTCRHISIQPHVSYRCTVHTPMDPKYLQILRDAKSLLDDGIFSDRQFEQKIEILMQQYPLSQTRVSPTSPVETIPTPLKGLSDSQCRHPETGRYRNLKEHYVWLW